MLQRLANLIRGFFGLFISGMERRNPEALLEVEKENLRAQIGQYNQGLASHAGLCERLMAQVKKLETEERELRAKATAHLKAGNREAAGQYALRLQTATRELSENRVQLEQAEKTYKDMVKARDVAIAAAKAKIEALKQGIEDLKVKRAMAELNEMAAGMISNIGGSGDTLNRLQEMVEEERNRAAGRARVAKDAVNMSEVNLQEAEQKALADQALADFAAKEGIAIESAAPAPAPAKEAAPAEGAGPVKSMGPAKSAEGQG
jgi:phage shock protein A